MRKEILILVTLITSFVVHAQEGLNKFGVQVKPIIPTNLFFSGVGELEEEGITYTINQKAGYSFGGVVRHDFKDWLSLETGISYVKRNFTANMHDASNDFKDTTSVGIVGYEIPIMGLVYVQLAEQIFMDVGFGLSLDMFPSDVANGNTVDFVFVGTRYHNRMMKLGLKTSIGWEYRTNEGGAFYVGGTLHRPFSPIYQSSLLTNNGSYEVNLPLSGNYLTLDFRYFFKGEKREKKEDLGVPEDQLPSWMTRGKK